MKSLRAESDIGSIKIYNDTMAFYIPNGIGDLPSMVIVCENDDPKELDTIMRELDPANRKIVNSTLFDIKDGAYLSGYDCGEEPIYKFKPGTYFVTLYEDAVFLIEWREGRVKA